MFSHFVDKKLFMHTLSGIMLFTLTYPLFNFLNSKSLVSLKTKMENNSWTFFFAYISNAFRNKQENLFKFHSSEVLFTMARKVQRNHKSLEIGKIDNVCIY